MVLHRCQPCWRATHRCHRSSGCFDARPTPLHGPPAVLVQKQAKQVTDEIFRRLITASQTPARLRRPSGLARAFLNAGNVAAQSVSHHDGSACFHRRIHSIYPPSSDSASERWHELQWYSIGKER